MRDQRNKLDKSTCIQYSTRFSLQQYIHTNILFYKIHKNTKHIQLKSLGKKNSCTSQIFGNINYEKIVKMANPEHMKPIMSTIKSTQCTRQNTLIQLPFNKICKTTSFPPKAINYKRNCC